MIAFEISQRVGEPLKLNGRPVTIEELEKLARAHRTDLEWKASQPSLSAAVAAVIERTKAEPDRRSVETQ